MSRAFWIDQQGGTRALPAGALAVESCPIRGFVDQASGLEIERGEVGVSWDRHRITVRLCLDRVTDRAFDSLLDRLRGSRREVVSICRYQGGWTGARAGMGLAAAERLSALHARRAVAHVPLFQVERPLSVLQTKDASPLLRLGLELWERGAGVFDEDRPGFARVLQRSQLSVPVAGNSAPRFVFVGPRSTAAAVWGAQWCAEEAPLTCSVPDRDFDARVGGIYHRIGESGEPRLHRIFALIRKHDGEFAWVPYDRLLLPFRFANGAPVFNCLTEFAPGFTEQALYAAA